MSYPLRTVYQLFGMKAQTAEGTANYPVAGDFLATISNGFKPGVPRTVQTKERIYNSFDIHKVLFAGYNILAGDVKAYIKPGTEGVIHGKQLLDAAFGKAGTFHAAAGGGFTAHTTTWTLYTPSDTPLWFTCTLKVDTAVFWLFDVRCINAVLPFNAEATEDSFFNGTFSLVAKSAGWAGTDTIKTRTTGVKNFKPNNINYFQVGGQVTIGANLDVLTISAVDRVLGVVSTLETVDDANVSEVITPYVPTATIPDGDEIWAGLGYLKQNSNPFAQLNGSLSIGLPLATRYEKYNTYYPTRIVESALRECKLTTDGYFSLDKMPKLVEPELMTDVELDLEFGETIDPTAAGAQWADFNMPLARDMSITPDFNNEDGAKLAEEYLGIAQTGGDTVGLTIATLHA